MFLFFKVLVVKRLWFTHYNVILNKFDVNAFGVQPYCYSPCQVGAINGEFTSIYDELVVQL